MAKIEKFSFHKSGICRSAFTNEHGTPKTMNDRAMFKWKRQPTPATGEGKASRVAWVAFPTDYLSRNADPSVEVSWIEAAAPGGATYVELAFTSESRDFIETAFGQRQERKLLLYVNLPGDEAAFIEAHAAEQRRVASNVLRWKDPGLRQVAEEKLASEILQPFLNSDASALSAATLAEKAGLEDWYRSLYMVLSWPTHSSAIDLDRHVVLGPDGEPSEFRNEPEIEDQEPTWACAIELLLKSMLALENIFSNVEKDKVESCYAAARLLLAETAG